MKRFVRLLLGVALAGHTLFAAATAPPQEPLYIVNGRTATSAEVKRIPPDEIISMESLPADEESIARYGEAAAEGVVIVVTRYDERARFEADSVSFDHYIASQVVWPADEPAARVVLRYRILANGKAEVDEVLEATDARFKRRVLKALADAPAWQPARKSGEAVESTRVLRVQLPVGKRIPPTPVIIIR